MKRVHVDFAPALSHARRTHGSLYASLIAALAVSVLIAAGWTLTAIEREHAAARVDIELAQAKSLLARSKAPPAAPRLGRPEITAINQAVRQLNLPWPDMFDAIERATPESIAVLSLTPDSTNASLTLVAEGRTTDSMLDYVRTLKAQPLFENVVVTRHEVNDKDPHKPVRFEVTANWRAGR